jgi:flavorubredoxin
MKAEHIADSVYCIHADINTEDLFEGIWPIPQGVSLNAYFLKGDKTALVDLIRDWIDAPKQIASALASIGAAFEDIDYLILNHLEPDHTGWLRELREKNPRIEIIATAKGINLVKSFYKIADGLRAVKDGDTLDLGKGKVLTFYETPNLHWPETMVTWDAQSGTLFSCDAFGSFGALGNRVFDDQFDETEHALFERETLRYYANIVASFSSFVERAVQKLQSLPIAAVAPSHGMAWRREPKKIIDRYLKYAAYAKGPAERAVTIIWGSMYGNTRKGLEGVIRGIAQEGVPYSLFRVPDDNVSYILAEAYRSTGLVLAMPTYEYAMFPPMSYILDVFRRKHITGKTALRIGSWGWIGGAKKDYEAQSKDLKWNHLEPVEWAGEPGEQELALLEAKGRELAQAVNAGYYR